MFDEYTVATKLYANHVQALLDAVHEKKKGGGPERNKLENLAGLLAKQLKQIKEIKPCIISLDPDQEELAPVEMIQEDFSTVKSKVHTSNQRRKSKKYAPYKKPKYADSAPTNHNKVKHRQKINKTRKVRADATDGCTGKRKLTYNQAITEGSRLLDESKDRSLRRMAIYQCMVCGEHHLTRQVHSPNKKGSTQVAVLIKEDGVA